MKQHLRFIEMPVPNAESQARCSIFLSSSWNTCPRLLVIIVGGKGIQPGIWSRSLVLESQKRTPNAFRSLVLESQKR